MQTKRADANWKQFELTVAEIQRQLAPQAKVIHNHRIKGRSGRRRQFDVFVYQQVGLTKVKIAFECKYLKRRVSIEKVEAFSRKLKDVGATAGVMVSALGFDGGSRSIAEQDDILLYTCNVATDVDWQKLVGPAAWLMVLHRHIDFPNIRINWLDFGCSVPPKDSDPIYANEQGKLVEVGSLRSLVFDEFNNPDIPIGTYSISADTTTPLYFRDPGGRFCQIVSIDITLDVSVTRYPHLLTFAEGHVMTPVSDGAPLVTQITSNCIALRQFATVEGKPITQEELVESHRQSSSSHQFQNMDDIPNYLRIVVTGHLQE